MSHMQGLQVDETLAALTHRRATECSSTGECNVVIRRCRGITKQGFCSAESAMKTVHTRPHVRYALGTKERMESWTQAPAVIASGHHQLALPVTGDCVNHMEQCCACSRDRAPPQASNLTLQHCETAYTPLIAGEEQADLSGLHPFRIVLLQIWLPSGPCQKGSSQCKS